MRMRTSVPRGESRTNLNPLDEYPLMQIPQALGPDFDNSGYGETNVEAMRGLALHKRAYRQ